MGLGGMKRVFRAEVVAVWLRVKVPHPKSLDHLHVTGSLRLINRFFLLSRLFLYDGVYGLELLNVKLSNLAFSFLLR